MSTSSALLDAPPRSAEPRPTPQSLWQRYHHADDDQVENDLVQQYLPLVRTVVARLAMTLPTYIDFNDLNSAGTIGLLQALRNFEPNSGASFETYARFRIRGAVLDELRRMDWVPRSVHEKSRKIEDTMFRLEQELGQTPTEAQMAKALNLTLVEYLACVDEVRPTTFICLDSIHQTEDGDGSSLHESVADDTQEDPTLGVSRRELAQVIKARLKDLPEMQRQVLALYYGEDLHLHEIAAAFGLTESRISQIHSQAILSIRSYLKRFEAGLASRPAATRSA